MNTADAPVRRAAALAYGAHDIAAQAAPRVVAKGEQFIADEIIARARAAGIPVHHSRELVALLMQVDLDNHIPPALYVAVAEVLAWAYRVDSGLDSGLDSRVDSGLARGHEAHATRPTAPALVDATPHQAGR
jgi:flagellar biosynthesis protein